MTRAPLATALHPSPLPLSSKPAPRPRVRGSPRRPPLLLLAPLLLALQACCTEEPRDALPTAPDLECQTGVEAGFDIAVWECVNEEHVVAHRRSTAFAGCSDVTVERVPCGELTPFEKEHTDGTRTICEPL